MRRTLLSLGMPLRNTLAALVLLVGLAAPAAAAPDDGGGWDPTLPKILSSGAPGDPVAIANAGFQASKIALQTTQNLGHQFLATLGLAPSTTAAFPGGRVGAQQAIEYAMKETE